MQPDPEPPEVTIDVSIPYQEWSEGERRPSTTAARAVREVFKCADLPSPVTEAGSVEVSVLLANDDLVRTLNREYRGKDKPTNVLSFPQIDYKTPAPEAGHNEEPLNIGDIIMGFETVIGESEEKLIPFDNHFNHLIVHGTLHLLGYDHISEEEAATMENLEILIMSRLGYQNPYSWQ